MRTDYEEHLSSCAHCRGWQRIHRMVDVTLIGLTTLSTLVFLLALAVLHREPVRNWALIDFHLHQVSVILTIQAAAVVGLMVSLVAWVLVAIMTPAPVYLTGVAMAQARVLQGRLPEELRDRFPRNAA